MENQSSRAATSFAASSSSSAADPNNSSTNNVRPYDVFINYRGEAHTFAGHLYDWLRSRGLRPFMDVREHGSRPEAAIGSALVHVAIFSQNYTQSQLCLHELVLMCQSGAPIIPVFYNVEPAEIRRTGDLDRLQIQTETIEKRKHAISAVAEMSGFNLANSNEGEMLELVQRVGEKIMDSYIIGLDLKAEEFETRISEQQQQSGEVQVVGIVGLCGAGKTTLALELFKRKRSKYEYSYFLSNVRENAKKSSLPALQRELLKGLTQLDCSIDNINDGIGKLETYLDSFNVLFVLDDIDHENQLDAFLPIKDVLGSDSLILITTRDKNVLVRARTKQITIYKLGGLTRKHSQELFSLYAFHQAYPLQGFEDLVNHFIEVCEGLPFSLKVLGAHLFRNNAKSAWEGLLQRAQEEKASSGFIGLLMLCGVKMV